MKYRAVFCTVFCVFLAALASGSDWPMWGYDAGRRNRSETEISSELEILWTRRLPEPRRAWPFQYEDYYTGGNPQRVGKLSFDVSYEPVAGGGMLFVPSMISDNVTAYAADTGEEIWRYYAGGPVRFAPVYSDGRVYFVSDDGYLYCVKSDTGELNWRFRGSFGDRTVLGNERLISIWPARGGPVIEDGVLYFAAGVVPFEGVFVHAVCKDTGEKIWTNSTSGSVWELHQHGGAWSYGGPSPQGYLAVSGDRLIVPGGRTPPAVYDRHTGEFLYFRQATGTVGKGAGGYRVHAQGNWFFNHGMLYSLDDGAQYGPVPATVLTPESFIGASGGRLTAHKAELRETQEEVADRLERRAISSRYELEQTWRDRDRGVAGLHFKAGGYLGVSMAGDKAALIRLSEGGRPESVVWEREVDGKVWRMITADGRIFVVTENGKLYCFGKPETPALRRHRVDITPYQISGEDARAAENIVSLAGKKEGYAVVAGAGGGFLAALAERTGLRVIAFDSPEETSRLRRELDEAGLYGGRVAVAEGKFLDSRLPPYFADLVVLAGGGYLPDEIEHAYRSLRPYGGKMYVAGAGREIREAELHKAGFQFGRNFALVEREGALTGAGQWTHQYGSAANRTYSDDALARPPFGVSWFGGPSNLNSLPRHHNGPIPQVAGGRLFVLGVDTLSARCVYTGRELWSRDFPGIGHPFTSLSHEEQFRSGREVYMPNHPGANFIGSPYVSLEDAVYVIRGESMLELDPSSGETLRDFRLPALDVRRNEWGHVMVCGDYLVATVDPQDFDEGEPGKTDSWNATSSSLLLAMDRGEGRVLWARSAERVGFRHNAIAAGNGRLFAVDGLSEEVTGLLRRRGLEDEMDSVLVALDIKTGEVLWHAEDAFGTWLGYYEDRDVLLEGGRHGQRGVLRDEPADNLFARRGETGEILWRYDSRYSGPLGLHSEMIIPGRPGQRALDPATGGVLRKEHPLTGEEYNWSYHRYYGCGTMNSSRHMVMFRSGAAGFADLSGFGGTANLGGFRSGCTNNLVAADGLLNAPEYTRTCTCSYQLQTSFGLVHVADAEMWTINRLPSTRGRIEAVGINLGAPGNRREDGVLWLEYPKVYRGGPDASADISGNSLSWFRNHASWIENPGDGYAWVASYGAEGVEGITVNVAPRGSDESAYDLSLYFAEPGGAGAGERVFDVYLQGKMAFEGLDVAALAGGPARVFKLALPGIPAEDRVEIRFSRRDSSLPAVVSGVQIVKSD